MYVYCVLVGCIQLLCITPSGHCGNHIGGQKKKAIRKQRERVRLSRERCKPAGKHLRKYPSMLHGESRTGIGRKKNKRYGTYLNFLADIADPSFHLLLRRGLAYDCTHT